MQLQLSESNKNIAYTGSRTHPPVFFFFGGGGLSTAPRRLIKIEL